MSRAKSGRSVLEMLSDPVVTFRLRAELMSSRREFQNSMLNAPFFSPLMLNEA